MFIKLAASTAIGLAGLGTTLAAAQNSPQPATQPPTALEAQPAPAARPSSLPSNTNADGTLKVVVHRRTVSAPEQQDARVAVGGVMVSSPNAAKDDSIRTDGAVVMPANTFGPGEPLWQLREREAAEIKLMKANADLARADADRARPYYNDFTYPRDILAENASYGRFDLGGPAIRLPGGVWGGPVGFGHFRSGLRGPVTTTVIRDDQLGSTAQREFNRAAMPPNDGSQDARDAAVRRFGNDSLPRINATQNAVDKAHNNANKERPEPKPR